MVTALHEDVPVLVIASQHRLGGVYPSPPSRFQGQDQLDLLRPAVKWGGPAFEWSRIPLGLALGLREMWNGRPGPVHVELPALVLYPTEDDETAPVTPPAAYGGTTPQASDAGSELPVVVLRLRGRTTLGATAFIVLANYAQRIRAAGGHLFLSGVGPDLLEQLQHAHRVDLQDAMTVVPASDDPGINPEGVRRRRGVARRTRLLALVRGAG
jgi:hypothetical protein